jgi:hypothetical protein
MTIQVIQRFELTSSQALIEFTSIPQTFTDLVLLFSGRSARVASFEEYRIYFNGANSNLSTRYLEGDGSSSASSTTANGFIGIGNSSNSTASTFGNTSIYIPNYTSSNAKSFSVDNVSEANGTTSYQDIVAGLWNQTAAINAITLTNGTGSNWLAGTSATLYGVLKGSDGIVTVS